MDHALNTSINRTDRFIALDIAVSGNVPLPMSKLYNNMERNNYYFESVTRYIQETTCTSKKTTTIDLAKLQIEAFSNYTTEEVTKVACEDGHVKCAKCLENHPYRSFDGTCNNMERPLDGSVRDCVLNLLPPDYKDGISKFRTSQDGSALPNARVLSTHLLGKDECR